MWRCGWAASTPSVLGMLERSGLADDIGRAHLYRNLEDAAGDARPETPG